MPRPTSRSVADGSAPAMSSSMQPYIRGLWPRALGCLLAVTVPPLITARGQEPRIGTEPQPSPSAEARSVSQLTAQQAGPSEAEIGVLRSEATNQFKALQAASAIATPVPPSRTAVNQRSALPPTSEPASSPAPPADKPLHDLLQERLNLLDEYEMASNTLKKTLNPEPSPAQQTAEAKEELRRLATALDQFSQRPETLLPEVFRNLSTAGAATLGNEVKEALERTSNDLKECTLKLETLRTEKVK